jgi:Family of unknown function (DUF6744)
MMTEQQPQSFEAYVTRMEQAPLLGQVALYSIFDGQVTHDRLAGWFDELHLDPAFLPPPIRMVDAFERVTGDVKHTYPLATAKQGKRGSDEEDGEARVATLLVRHVKRGPDAIVRHLVREVRDAEQETLEYDVKVGECAFRRDPGSTNGAGKLTVAADFTAVPDPGEQREIRMVLDRIAADFRHRCQYLTGDRLRAVVRDQIEGLNALKVRPTGGVYFVHAQYRETLVRLRDLVKRFGAGSNLYLIPLPDETELRDMVVQAFRTKAREDLERLAKEIAAARRADPVRQATVEALDRQFRRLQEAAAEHQKLLAVDLEDTGAALDLVRLQIIGLLTAVE